MIFIKTINHEILLKSLELQAFSINAFDDFGHAFVTDGPLQK